MKFIGAHIFDYDATFRSNVNVTGNLDVDGTINIDAADIDGNLQLDGTLTVGVDDTGYDVKFFGATSGRYMLWDESDDSLQLPDNTVIKIGTGLDLKLKHDGTDSYIDNTTGDLKIRNFADDKDIIFQSDDGSGGTETYFFLDGSAHNGTYSRTIFPDNSLLGFGTGFDSYIYHDGSHFRLQNNTGDLRITCATDDGDIAFYTDDGSGGTTAYLTLDGSAGDIKVHKNFEIEKTLTLGHTADPPDPATGHSVVWSDTSGNLKIKINVAGTTVTKTITTYE